jgi:hypothetical protein
MDYHPSMASKIAVLLAFSVILVTHSATSHGASGSAPFQIKVVDEQTGVGVPHLRIITDNGINCYTRENGGVLWDESSLMDEM